MFTAPGITIPAENSVLGKEIAINPETGDNKATDISVLQMKSGQESFVEAQTVK